VKVLDASGAEIHLGFTMDAFLGAGTRTDASGRAVRAGLPPGRATVVVGDAAGHTVRTDVSFASGSTTRVEVELK
jgi:hypothetical protein